MTQPGQRGRWSPGPVTWTAWATLAALGYTAGCSSDTTPSLPPQAETRPIQPASLPTPPIAGPPHDTAPSWAGAVHALAEGEQKSGRRLDERAVIPDRAYSGASRIAVRRLVYRVHFVMPKTFREHRTLVRPPAGELTLDVSNDRLRARFSGPAWPVHEGAQIRLRRDTLGVYVFDGTGGHQLSPGQLALWFEGRATPGVHASVRVRRETGKVAPGPGELVCALLAEWTNQPRDAVMRRCSHGALPPWFGFGPWRAELTAVVPIELPASQMRADELDPPSLPSSPSTRPVLATSELGQISPLRPTTSEGSDVGSGRTVVSPPALRITNQAESRALVCAAGIPMAWIDAHSEGTVTGLSPGFHMIGALRPFGTLALTRRPIEVPGEVTLRGSN